MIKQDITNLIDKYRSSNAPAQNGNTIVDLNGVIRPLYEQIIVPTINKINDALENKLGKVNAPKFKLVSNVDLDQSGLNRNFILIVFQNANTEYNPLTNPYLLIEGAPSGKIAFILSNFKNAEKLDEIDNVYASQNDFVSKFDSSFQTFIDKI